MIAAGGAIKFGTINRGAVITLWKYRVDIASDTVDVEFSLGTSAPDSRKIKAVRLGEAPGFPASLINDAVNTSKLIEKLAIHGLG